MIAINLSTWATAVIDETLHALHLDTTAQQAREDHAGKYYLRNPGSDLHKTQDFWRFPILE